jgi:hypothetical protein
VLNNCSLIKEDWLDACIALARSGWRCIGRFPPALAYNLLNPPANGKQGPLTLLSQRKLALTTRNTIFAL